MAFFLGKGSVLGGEVLAVVGVLGKEHRIP